MTEKEEIGLLYLPRPSHFLIASYGHGHEDAEVFVL
jgi:hypothetical protein